MPVIEMSKKEVVLAWVLYIYYLLCFWKDINKIQALVNFNSKLNAMTLAYISKLSLKVCQIDVRAQKIDGFTL